MPTPHLRGSAVRRERSPRQAVGSSRAIRMERDVVPHAVAAAREHRRPPLVPHGRDAGVGRPVIVGQVCVDRRTKRLTQRLRPGDIAVIDHEDLDETSARELVYAGARAVLNAASSITGRYPNPGPKILLEAGVPLVDELGPELMELSEGSAVEIAGDEVLVLPAGRTLRGRQRQLADVLEAMEQAKVNLEGELERFLDNTLRYAQEEKELVLAPLAVPPLKVAIRGRQVLVVVRGQDHRQDLQALKSYIRDIRPVLIGVDGGADALLEFGLRPDLIIGDMDSVSEAALRSGAELVVHAYPDGTAPGLARLEALGLRASVLPAPGTSEDVALLLAHQEGATLIVAVGTHLAMVEFLEKGRKGMASTMLTRMKVGGILVDAKGVSRLYQARVQTSHLVTLVAAGIATMVLIFFSAPSTRAIGKLLWIRLRFLLGL
jgi:uncharacterized membrane-anchored protein